MELEFRLMMVWGVQCVFPHHFSVCLCTLVDVCKRIWLEEWDIKTAWLLGELET